MPNLRVHLLGTLDIHDGDQPLSKPPTLKSQSLLAYLICYRQQPQPREWLADLFWGDRPAPKARHSLATALWHIRRCLPAEKYILSDFHTMQFNPQADLWLDVDRFESGIAHNVVPHLESAVALYRGDFLVGFYDDWIINERYRLEALFSDALARLMASQETSGEYEDALSTALRLLHHDPVREDAHRLAMRAYCRLGQRNAALEQYHRCREIVQQELCVEPMVETVDLYRAILEDRFAAERTRGFVPPQALPPQPPVPLGRSPLDALAPSRLVGRGRELGFLQECWQRARVGQGGIVLISGEAGVGKSHLADEFANRLRWQGIRVLWGRCYEFECPLPYHPISEALRTILPTLTPAELANLTPWAIAEVARLVPEMAEQYPTPHIPAAMRSDQEQARLFEGVACFLGQLSLHQALLVGVEDLHWASESTLQLMHYLARQLAGQQVLLVCTLRPEALGRRHPLRAFQRQLCREGLARSLRLSPLSPEAVQAMVIEMSGAGDAVVPLAQRLYRETEGNPFFLIETAKALFDVELIHLERGIWQGDFARISAGELPLPASLSEAIQAQVDSLSDDAQEVLRLAAMLGREFDFDPLNLLWGRGAEATLEVLDVLLRQRLIEEGSGVLGRDYAFIHPKIQEVIYAGTPSRRPLHRRVAQVLEDSQPDDAVALAWHFERAGEPGRAACYALQAGLAAKCIFAHAEAGVYFDRALALLKREAARLRDPEAIAANQRLCLQALLERGWVLRLPGNMEAYARDLEEVARLARSLGDQHTLAHLRYREAYTHRWFCRYAQAREAAEEGVRLSQASADSALEARCWREVGLIARASGDYDQAQEALEQAIRLFAALNDVVYQIHVLSNLATLCWYQGEYDEAIDLSQQALARCDEAALPLQRRLPLGDMGAAAAATGDGDLARQCLLESLSIARQIADCTQEIFCLGHLGWLCVREKQAAQALEHLQAALILAENIDSRAEQSWLLLGLAEAQRLAGDTGQAATYASRALELAQASGQVYDQVLARRILAGLAI